jgi:hypothetical protein
MADYFWKQPQIIWSQIREIWWAFHFNNTFLGQKLLDREHLVSWSTVTVDNPFTGPKFRHNFHISLIDCLPLLNEFKVNNTLDIKESDEHCLYL